MLMLNNINRVMTSSYLVDAPINVNYLVIHTINTENNFSISCNNVNDHELIIKIIQNKTHY